MHPDDAARRNLTHGQVVRVESPRGACLAGLHVTDMIRQGVVQIATGAWYDPAEPGNPDSLCKHGNPNVLTLDIGSSALAQAPISQTTLVEVSGCQSPPTVAVTHPPPLKPPLD